MFLFSAEKTDDYMLGSANIAFERVRKRKIIHMTVSNARD